MKTFLERLFAHVAWADARVLESVRRADPAPDDVRELLAHLVAAEEVWLSRLEGRVPQVPVWPPGDLAATASLLEESRSRYAAYLSLVDDELLASTVEYVNSAGRSFASRVDDVLAQVLLHGAYHRGQIALRLRQAGQEPAPTDYIAFVRGAPAATRQGPGPRGG